MRSEGWIPGDSGSLEGGSAVATEFLGHSVGKGKIFIFCFLNIFSDPIPIFESGFDCNHSPVFSEFPVSVSLANSCNKFLCENRMNISIKFNMSVQIDFELFQSRVILFDAQKTILMVIYDPKASIFEINIFLRNFLEEWLLNKLLENVWQEILSAKCKWCCSDNDFWMFYLVTSAFQESLCFWGNEIAWNYLKYHFQPEKTLS